jgi:hypothetical protein
MSAFYKWSGYPLSAFACDLVGLAIIVVVALNESPSWSYLPSEVAGMRTVWLGLPLGLAFYLPGTVFRFRKKRERATASQ